MKTGKKSPPIIKAESSKDTWTLENALYILGHPTVDSKLWAEAVEWLMFYGPEHIKELLLQASGHATSECFPSLKPRGFDVSGTPVYEVGDLAEALGISQQEAHEILEKKQDTHHGEEVVTDSAYKLQ